MTVKPLFKFEETVYLKTDTEQLPRIVTGYELRPNGQILYLLSHVNLETRHYCYEISIEKDKELLAEFK